MTSVIQATPCPFCSLYQQPLPYGCSSPAAASFIPGSRAFYGQAPRRAQGMKTKLKWTFQTLMYEQWVLLRLLISRGGKVLACSTLEPPGVLVARTSSELSHRWAVTASHPSSRPKEVSICQFVFFLSLHISVL